jgi:hypothetical protein
MQYSADIWADWKFDCTLQSTLDGSISIAINNVDPPFAIRDDEGGSAFGRLENSPESFESHVLDSFVQIPWDE